MMHPPSDTRDDVPAHRRRSTERRRAVLECLRDRSRPATVSELADELAERSAGPSGRPSPHRLAVRLHHVDLPRLDDAGLVEYDVRDRTVAPGNDPPEGEWPGPRVV